MRKKLDMKRRLLAKVEKDSMISSVNNRVRELNLEIDTLLDKENRMWLQRSETLWATQGDRITHFFSQ